MKKPEVKIKSMYQHVQVGYNNSVAPLGVREDLEKLAVIAHESGNPDLLKLFSELPSLADLRAWQVEQALENGPKPTAPTQGGGDANRTTTKPQGEPSK